MELKRNEYLQLYSPGTITCPSGITKAETAKPWKKSLSNDIPHMTTSKMLSPVLLVYSMDLLEVQPLEYHSQCPLTHDSVGLV